MMHERLRHQRADRARLPCSRIVSPFECRVIPDAVGCLAMRDLPEDLTAIEIDGVSRPYGGFSSGRPCGDASALTAPSFVVAAGARAAPPARLS
jgi:hypothetical protein